MSAREPVLAAQDAEDLQVISARLQDAVARLGDLVYLPKKRRFAGVFNRFKWEESSKRRNLRVRAGLHFDGVLSAKSQKLKRGAPDAVVELLAIRFAQKTAADPSGTVELVFAGGGAIVLEVECLDAGLADMSGEWAARGRPAHETEEN
ncbi:MAG: DUF2948 family protein [Alphaproteobacteria bacterium]|nr:DUF2948 family protein [Alphaproteobacteria bacterium]MDE2112125.1 DUF2948 family protein [Alphaproteobacteria bacterium]MDE2493923.1 DUF2948 family protein [Alphaproteobacteria bacterium]